MNRLSCGLTNCDNIRTISDPGASIGYEINNLTREVVVCSSCAIKIMGAPRGSLEITKHKELRRIPDRKFFIS